MCGDTLPSAELGQRCRGGPARATVERDFFRGLQKKRPNGSHKLIQSLTDLTFSNFLFSFVFPPLGIQIFELLVHCGGCHPQLN